MKVAPDESLRAVQATVYYDGLSYYPVIVFDDGSVWRRNKEKWLVVWQPIKPEQG